MSKAWPSALLVLAIALATLVVLLPGCGGSSSSFVYLTVQGRPAWGPGGRVALSAVGGDRNLYIWTVSEAGGAAGLLTTGSTVVGAPAGGSDPAYSPDGTKIVFSGRRGTPTNRVALYAMSATSGEVGGLTAVTDGTTATEGYDAEPWYIDGNNVVFSSNRGTSPPYYLALWTVNLVTGPGSATKLPTTGLPANTDMKWAAPNPLGTGVIVFQGKNQLTGLSAIYKMAAGAGGVVTRLFPLTDDGRDYGGPSFEPTLGTSIVFHSNRASGGNDYDIWKVNLDGSGPTQLTSTADTDGFPVYKPTGTRIGFIRGNEFWTMNPDGTLQTRVTEIFR
jgi:Tol biopolymer transport system component